MTLARQPGPGALLSRLAEIDATRAPLHPLLLQIWLAAVGPSDAAGRAFSALCGIATVALIYRLGRLVDRPTALWAAALATVSPLLVYYDREARMYAGLVALTCLAWLVLLGRWDRVGGRLAYAGALVALGLAHPLGLLMGATLALASLGLTRADALPLRAWLAPHALAGLVLLPWLPRYLDHPPEYTIGRLPWKFLLGTPIGFVGGNFATLGLLALVIAWGAWRSPGGDTGRRAGRAWLAWLLIPPTVLYGYSLVGHPIFGPNRYTLFVAPAFLLLVARGVAALPGPGRWAAGLATLGLSVATLPGMVYVPDLKADWRAAARVLAVSGDGPAVPLVVTSGEPGARNLETITAAYYVGDARPIVPMPEAAADLPRGPFWLAVGRRRGVPTLPWPAGLPPPSRVAEVPGLRLGRFDAR